MPDELQLPPERYLTWEGNLVRYMLVMHHELKMPVIMLDSGKSEGIEDDPRIVYSYGATCWEIEAERLAAMKVQCVNCSGTGVAEKPNLYIPIRIEGPCKICGGTGQLISDENKLDNAEHQRDRWKAAARKAIGGE